MTKLGKKENEMKKEREEWKKREEDSLLQLSVNDRKVSMMIKNMEQRLIQNIASPGDENELVTTLAKLANLNDFKFDKQTNAIFPPDNFLKDVEKKIKKEKPDQLERLQYLQSQILKNILEANRKNVNMRMNMLSARRPSTGSSRPSLSVPAT